jgi:hypothetical protein
MLSRQDWKNYADVAAAHKHGEETWRWRLFKRRMAGPWGVAAAAGAVGFGAWWLWDHAADALGGVNTPPSSSGFLAVAVLLIIATTVAFRPRSMPTPAHILILKVAVFGALWLGLVAFGVSYLFS